MQNIHDIKVFACVIGVSALLIYGLNRQWRWLIDPPEWMFAFYFPATVKITLGPKYVLSAAYLSIYGALLISSVGLIQVLLEKKSSSMSYRPILVESPRHFYRKDQ